jgi:hypothetical protein
MVVVPLQVNGSVTPRSHIMEQRKSRLLTVEGTFFSVGRGIYVLPNIPYASYRGPCKRNVTLRTPDGRERTEFLELIGPFITPPPKELYYQCLLASDKEGVPIGTEIWLRSRLQEEFCDALRRGNVPEIETLVRAGADVNDFGAGGWTPLMGAADLESVDIARLLLDLGADVNRSNSGGETALHCAVDRSLDDALHTHGLGAATTEMVTLLLERGASLSAVDHQGQTALDLAERYGPNKIADLLRSWQEHMKSQLGATSSAGSADAPPKQDR